MKISQMGALDQIGTTVLRFLLVWVDSRYDMVATKNVGLHAYDVSRAASY
jgi:hypothetical protein